MPESVLLNHRLLKDFTTIQSMQNFPQLSKLYETSRSCCVMCVATPTYVQAGVSEPFSNGWVRSKFSRVFPPPAARPKRAAVVALLGIFLQLLVPCVLFFGVDPTALPPQ